MDSMFEDDITILTQEALCQDEGWLDSPAPSSPDGRGEARSPCKQPPFPAFQLQKSKEREEQLDEMIRAYEKLCVEKADLESELGEMVALVETHLTRIRNLEQQLRQRDGNSFQNLSSQLQNQEVQYLSLHGSPGLTHGESFDSAWVEGWPSPAGILCSARSMGWQSPRSLEQPGELEVRRLEAELDETRHEAQSWQRREEQLKAECERLQSELKQLQETRAQDLATSQSERDMAWVKKVGDDHYLLVSARPDEEFFRGTRDGEESNSQSRRGLGGGKCWNSCSHAPSCLTQGAHPAFSRGTRVLVIGEGASPTGHVPPLLQLLVFTGASWEGFVHCDAWCSWGAFHTITSINYATLGVNLALAYTELTEELCRLRSLSSLQSQILRTLLQEQALNGGEHRARVNLALAYTELTEELCRLRSLSSLQSQILRTLLQEQALNGASAPPQLLMETVDSDIRSCPLCQLAFPIGYPDDALIKHIDSHLENSKI
nr:TANK-binding kinase 1-binding protein 1 [Pelodiscus sinensis]|eukprot:XP_014429598.1 TANK-binding kinase 1-binding protein 1 [Pelodiscus sinensis]